VKTTIEVADRKEAALIRRGLADPATRALVKVMGALAALPTDRARIRTMRFVEDHFMEEGESL
jgi:hypothetical protein